MRLGEFRSSVLARECSYADYGSLDFERYDYVASAFKEFFRTVLIYPVIDFRLVYEFRAA